MPVADSRRQLAGCRFGLLVAGYQLPEKLPKL